MDSLLLSLLFLWYLMLMLLLKWVCFVASQLERRIDWRVSVLGVSVPNRLSFEEGVALPFLEMRGG